MATNQSSQRGNHASSSDLNPGLRARQALDSGDFKLARKIAHDVLQDPQSPQAAKDEATIIIDATKIDTAPLVAGLVMFVVLALVFFYAIQQHHPA